jgi:hypothetical protein
MDSPRQQLRAAIAACVQRITKANGFSTDVGLAFTLEPGQVDADNAAVLTVLVTKQQRASQAALVRTHRLTTVVVVVKVPAALDEAQAALDAAISDVEEAMSDQQGRYPVGIEFPQYLSMEPVKPDAGAGWVGAVVSYQSHIPK